MEHRKINRLIIQRPTLWFERWISLIGNEILKSITKSIDTSTSGGKLIFSTFGAIAEFERNLIQERTKAGLAAARARGRLGGRPKKLDAKKIELAKKLYASKEHTIVEICEAVGVSKATLYKYL